MGQKIVIIGGVACGPKAAARARRRDPEAEITIVEKRDYVSYASCGLPYYVGGTVPQINELTHTSFGCCRDVAYFDAIKNIKVIVETEAVSIDREAKKVKLKNVKTGEESELPYDKLVMATGARPKSLPVPGTDLDNVWNLWGMGDADQMRQKIEAGEADRICVIGAGLIGLEAAEALMNQAVDVTMVEFMPQVLFNALDRDMAVLVNDALMAENVVLRLGEKVTAIEGDGKVQKVVTDKGEIETDGVLIAVGAQPNIELAKDSGLELGETGAIKVGPDMLTSDPDIYAGGDCVEDTHIVTKKKVWIPLGSVANMHGRVIGDNLTGGSSEYPGVLGTGIMRTLGTNVASTGITEAKAKDLGYDAVSGMGPFTDKSHYYPGGKNITIKIVADKKDGKVLGVQVVGPGDVARVVDAGVTALTKGATLDDIGYMDFAYAPPFGVPIEPLSQTANILRNKLDGIASSIGPLAIRELLETDEEVLLLDVRTPEECEKRPGISDSRCQNIDMAVIRKELDKLPKDKKVVVVCQLGQRAYDVSTALKGAGFEKTQYLEGGLNVFERSGD